MSQTQNESLYSMLLESGTNELEIMEFTIGNLSYGINVAKVREIIKFTEILPLPHATPALPGIVKVRNEIIPVIDLAEHLALDYDKDRDQERDLFIVTYFNQTTVAFRVHAVQYISRFSWENIENMGSTGSSLTHGASVVAIAKAVNRIILILDYEKILADLYPAASITAASIDALESATEKVVAAPILIAEDSEFLRTFLCQAIGKAGHEGTIVATNGLEAWQKINSFKERGGSILDYVSLVISDIEMPQMDGQHLLKCIKEDPFSKDVPVVMFSSLISESMTEKCRELGASEMVSKPEIERLISLVKRYTEENSRAE